MQSLAVLVFCVSAVSANVLNRYLMNMATQGMDPITRSLMTSSMGGDLFDMDTGGGGQMGYGGLGGGMPYGMYPPYFNSVPTASGMTYPQGQSFLPPAYSGNTVAPSGAKANNPYNPTMGVAGPASGAQTIISPSAVPTMPGMMMPSSQRMSPYNFFNSFLTFRALQWLDFF